MIAVCRIPPPLASLTKRRNSVRLPAGGTGGSLLGPCAHSRTAAIIRTNRKVSQHDAAVTKSAYSYFPLIEDPSSRPCGALVGRQNKLINRRLYVSRRKR